MLLDQFPVYGNRACRYNDAGTRQLTFKRLVEPFQRLVEFSQCELKLINGNPERTLQSPTESAAIDLAASLHLR